MAEWAGVEVGGVLRVVAEGTAVPDKSLVHSKRQETKRISI